VTESDATAILFFEKRWHKRLTLVCRSLGARMRSGFDLSFGGGSSARCELVDASSLDPPATQSEAVDKGCGKALSSSRYVDKENAG
jgi:hypothetical protein